MLNKTDAVLKNAKPFQRSQILYLKVAACLFQRIAAREQFPVTLGLKLDDHCGFSSSGHVNENEEEGKENYARNALKNIIYMVGLEGLEPSAKGL